MRNSNLFLYIVTTLSFKMRLISLNLYNILSIAFVSKSMLDHGLMDWHIDSWQLGWL